VEDVQRFTSQWVPNPRWVLREELDIPEQHVNKAAATLIEQLGPDGVQRVGGKKWWQWRRKKLRAEWIEMRADHRARNESNEPLRRAMLYLHGGAFFFGSVDEHRYQMQRHARKLRARVLAR